MIKRMLFVIFMIAIMTSISRAQQKETYVKGRFMSNKELAGIWQRGNDVVGNGLGQNFQFSQDGQFVLNVGDETEDLQVILKLKGKYRLDKDQLYFTILTKMILEGGEIGVGDSLDGNVFSIQDAKRKEVKVNNPKEMQDGCIVRVYTPNHIRIINVDYYKIDQKKYKIDADEIERW